MKPSYLSGNRQIYEPRQQLRYFQLYKCSSPVTWTGVMKTSEAAILMLAQIQKWRSVSGFPQRFGLGSIQGQFMWYLCWAKWHWDAIYCSLLVFPSNSPSVDGSILFIIWSWYNRSTSGQCTECIQCHPHSTN
jgi:hypothetical protein